MSYAPNYTPGTSFADDETNNVAGRSLVKTDRLDSELADISASINALNTNQKNLQRDDGKLADNLVEPYALAEQTRALIASGGIPKGEWAINTNYSVGDAMQLNNVAYLCVTAHNSGSVFTPNLWLAISGDGSSLNNAQAAAASAAAALISQNAAGASSVSASSSATSALASKNAASTSEINSGNSASSASVSAMNAANSAIIASNAASAAANTPVAAPTHAAPSKATPVDADEIPLIDSAYSFSLKRLTWANLKAALKTYFDTLYNIVVVNATNDPTFASASGANAASPEWVSGYVGKKAIGVNQTWQSAELTNTGATFTDGTAKFRALSTTYTNSTGRPISVEVSISTAGTTPGLQLLVAGDPLDSFSMQVTSGNYSVTVGGMVPDGATFRVNPLGTGGTISFWKETRA